MRRALGRLLGILLGLVLTSVLALGALSLIVRELGSPETRALPLYFNPAPPNVHDLAAAAIEGIATGRDAENAARELARLGGAALPHVLPKLDELRPNVRGRVALALSPVARRMDVASEAELATPERAIAFWARFWQDHAFDFRPQIARRLVARFAARSSALRREDLVHLDTYALPELMASLGRIRTQDDIERAARLTLALSHVTGRPDIVRASMTLRDARRVARSWRRFWAEQGADYVTLDGPRRVTAMFAETRYAKWLGRVLGVVRIGYEQGAVFGIEPWAALGSLLRALGALGTALLIATGWVAAELGTRRRALRVASRMAAALLAGVPPTLLAWMAAGSSSLAASLLTASLAGLAGAAALSRAALTTAAELGDVDSPARIALRAVLRAAPATLGLIATALFGLELVLDLDGAARATVHGLAQGDVTPGMALALGSAAFAAAVTALADGVLGGSRAGVRPPALVEVGALSRPARVLGLTALVLLGVFAAIPARANPAELGWAEVTLGARALLGYGVLTLAIAALSGVILGAAAASGPRAADAILRRCVELTAALPVVLWAAALASALGVGWALAVCLGALRGIDVAWLLRSELLFRATGDQELGVRSLGRFPLAAYFRQRLRPAFGPAASALALTPAWVLVSGVTGRLLGLATVPGQQGWDAVLASRPLERAALASPTILLLLVLTTGVLLALVTSPPRRIGAARASLPPPPPS